MVTFISVDDQARSLRSTYTSATAGRDIAALGIYSHCDLPAGLRRGRPEAITGLIDALGARLYDYLSLMLGDRDAATRALADTVIVGLGHVGLLHEPRLPAWLFALARGERMRQQRAAAQRTMPDALGELTAVAVLRGTPEVTTWAELAYLAMARMELWEREILVLEAMRPALSMADIAAILGTGGATVAEVHRRAVRRLCEQTTSLGFPPDVTTTELMAVMSGDLLGRVPRQRVIYMCLSPDLAGRRRRIQERAGPFGLDGFPRFDAYVPAPVRVARHRRAPKPHRLMLPVQQ